MKKHQLILTKSAEVFQEQVDKFCADGWLIVPGSVIIKETDSGRQWFSCIMENQIRSNSVGRKTEVIRLLSMLTDGY